MDYDDQEDPLTTGRYPTSARGCAARRAMYPAQIFLEKNQQPASHYFKNNFYFTIETEEPELPEAIEFLGAERFLFATDYPHDDPGGRMKFEDVRAVERKPKNLRNSEGADSLQNAERLFHWAC